MRDDRRVQGVKRLEKGTVVEGEWTEREGVSGEGNQPDTVALQLLDEIGDREARPLEPVRHHVLRQHAARRIDREDQVDAPAFHLAEFEAILRSRHREENAEQTGDPQALLEVASPARNRIRELPEQTGMSYFLQIPLAMSIPTCCAECKQDAHGEADPDPDGLCECQFVVHRQGRRRNRVSPRSRSRPRNSRPGSSAKKNSSSTSSYFFSFRLVVSSSLIAS